MSLGWFFAAKVPRGGDAGSKVTRVALKSLRILHTFFSAGVQALRSSVHEQEPRRPYEKAHGSRPGDETHF